MAVAGTQEMAAREQVGGHPVLDLVNTISWRFDPARRRELLSDSEALGAWAEIHLEVPQGWDFADPSVVAVRAMRDQLIDVLDAHEDGEAIPSESCRALFEAAARYLAVATASASLPLKLEPADFADDALACWLAEQAVTLLRSDDALRVRRCAAPDCGWFFLDQTKNHSRKWCQATGCGNRSRTRRYTARTRAGSTTNHPPLSR